MNLLSILKKGVDILDDFENGKIKVYKTLIPCIDAYIAIIAGSTNYICARPGQGKTHLVMQVFKNMIKQNKVCYFSGEDSTVNFPVRILSTFTNAFIPANVYDKNLNENQWTNITKRVALLAESSYIENAGIINCSNWNIDKVLEAFKKLENKNCEIVIYDYVQLIKTKNKNIFERHTEISERITEYFETSKMAFIGILQINRSKGDDPNKMPQLSDLFGSGSYEKDAFSISIINKIFEKADVPSGYNETDYYAYLIRKNRLKGFCPSLTIYKDYSIASERIVQNEKKQYKDY